MIGSLFNLIVQPAAERSAVASDNSKALCSQVKSGNPSISIILPLKIFFLFFSIVNRPFFFAK